MEDTNRQEATILVVEDDRRYRMLMTDALRANGYSVVEADDGRTTVSLASSREVDLVLLDVMLPDRDGFDLCRWLRGITQVPIIIVTARSDEQHKIGGLDAGADDYLTKPFSIGELLARVRAALRRSARPAAGTEEAIIRCGDLCLDTASHRVTVSGREVVLTGTEYRLLLLLATNAGHVLEPEWIISHVWGIHDGDMRSVLKTTMGRLRQKLGDDPNNPIYIETRRGLGYLFMLGVETSSDTP